MECEWLKKRSIQTLFKDFEEGLKDKQERFVFTLLWSTLVGKPLALPKGIEFQGSWDASSIAKAMAVKGWARASMGSARKVVCILREKLNRLARSPRAIKLDYRVQIPERRYNLVIEPYPRSSLERFWFPHLTNGQKARIVLTEQHEYWYGEKGGRRYRDWRLRLGNGPTEPIESLNWRSPRQVRLGDVQGMLAISSYFSEWGEKNPGFPGVRLVGSKNFRPQKGQNLIVLGSSGDWWAFGENAWGDFPLYLEGRTLIERFQHSPDDPYILGPEMPNSRPPLDCCGVLVSRNCTDRDGSCVTIVNGSHPVAVKAVCELLSNDRALSARLADLSEYDFSRGFPPGFQLFFAVWLSPNEARSILVKLLQFNAMKNRVPEPEYDEGEPSKLRSAVYLYSRKPAPPEGVTKLAPIPKSKLPLPRPIPPRIAPRSRPL
jgi:hypothetical protein